MEIYHLANNIVQFTEQFEIVNVRNYNGIYYLLIAWSG